MKKRAPLAVIDDETLNFRLRFLKVASLVVAVTVVILSVILSLVQDNTLRTLLPLSLLIPTVITYVLARKKHAMVPGYVFLSGVFIVYSVLIFRNPDAFAASSGTLAVAIVVSAFIVHRKAFMTFCAYGALFALFVNLYFSPGILDSRAETTFFEIMVMVLSGIFAYYFSGNSERLQNTLRSRLERIEETIPSLATAGERIRFAATELHGVAVEQREGALRQSSAVEETRAALHSSLSSSKEIANSAQVVLRSARDVLENNEQVAVQFEELSTKADRISGFVVSIKDIANKSDLLALNAAIEASQAGEHGQGFSLVATQMQKLTENIMDSLRMIEKVTKEIADASAMVRSSIDNARQLAETTAVAAHEIFASTTQQQTSTEQVARAMDDIADITQAVSIGSDQAMNSAEELKAIADNVPELMEELTSE